MSKQYNIFGHLTSRLSGIATAFLLLVLLNSCRKEELDPITYPSKSVDIAELEIRTSDMGKAFTFWSETLGMPIIDTNTVSFTVKIGSSRLTYRLSNTTLPPVNHFAISIPGNQIEKALDWLKNTDGKYANGPKNPVEIITDEITGAEISSNPIYNSHSIYINDGTGNIIELIARHDFGTNVTGDFNQDQLLKISEVAVVTKNITKCLGIVSEEFGVDVFPNSTSSYKPVGGADGIILLIMPNKPWKPTESILSEPFETIVTLRYPEDKTILLPNMVTYSTFTIKTEP
ncbi:MAG TPA: hypothetical protein PL185_05265 [Flavobacteriales bacterium]|nr:hypothetical protein [Flavobacteriales bacterium]